MRAIIEIPKGDNRRRHVKKDKSGFVDSGLLKDAIPVNGGIMPVSYGYIPETLNETDGDEVDILILSERKLEIGQEMEVEPIALLKREDGDDKVVATDETKKSVKNWNDVAEDERKLIENFFSHYFKIQSIENAEAAKKYIANKGHSNILKNIRM